MKATIFITSIVIFRIMLSHDPAIAQQYQIVTSAFSAGFGISSSQTGEITTILGQPFVEPANTRNSVSSGFLSKLVSLVPTNLEPSDEDKPAVFELHQNYPNPFNPATTIRFGIAEEGYTSLKIYDLLGREVAILTDKNMGAGNYMVTWDATRYPSGIYIYRLTSGNSQKIRKLILLK
jgi:hypothetical protein